MKAARRLRWAPLAAAVALAAFASGISACAPREASPPALPAGAWLSGDARALRSVLEGLRGLEGTRVGRTAAALADHLAECERVLGHAPDGAFEGLLDSLRCASSESAEPAALAGLRGDASLVFVVPWEAGGLVATARVDSVGNVDLRARVRASHDASALALLLPGPDSAGPARLARANALVHARMRPEGGLDLASTLRAGGQADRMFRLTSSLFSGAALDGTWELAVYMPRDARAVPPVALALGMRVRSAALAGVESFVRDLEATWPVRSVPARFVAQGAGGIDGACLPDLRILPEFSPCYAATDETLVFGWNPGSIELAFARPEAETGAEAQPPAGRIDGLVAHIDRYREADERLRQRLAPSAPRAPLSYAWDRLSLERVDSSQAPDAPGLPLRLQLRTRGAS